MFTLQIFTENYKVYVMWDILKVHSVIPQNCPYVALHNTIKIRSQSLYIYI